MDAMSCTFIIISRCARSGPCPVRYLARFLPDFIGSASRRRSELSATAAPLAWLAECAPAEEHAVASVAMLCLTGVFGASASSSKDERSWCLLGRRPGGSEWALLKDAPSSGLSELELLPIFGFDNDALLPIGTLPDPDEFLRVTPLPDESLLPK